MYSIDLIDCDMIRCNEIDGEKKNCQQTKH